MSSTKARSASKTRSGSWAVTSRQLTFAWAWAGMIVFVPAPWNPPQMPLTSSVGRAPLRSSDAEPGLAGERRHADLRPVRLLVERQRVEQRALLVGQGDDVVVEAGDEDPAVGTLERRDDPGERIGRVVDDAAVAARVEVDVAADDVDLGVHHAPQRDRDRRQVALEEARVADDRDVGGEPLAVGREPAFERRRARLLVALEDEPEVDRQRAARRQDRLGRPELEVDLALVVGRAAAEHLARRRRPARTAASPRARAGRPAGRRSGSRRSRSGRPRRGASRRRRSGCPSSPRPTRSRRPIRSSSAAIQSAVAWQSAACCGSAEMLGMRSSSLYESSRRSRVSSRKRSMAGSAAVVVVMAGNPSRSGVVTGSTRRGPESKSGPGTGPLVGSWVAGAARRRGIRPAGGSAPGPAWAGPGR